MDNKPTKRKATKQHPKREVVFYGNHINYLAKSLRDSKPTGAMDIEVWKRVVHTIASDIGRTNKLFEPARFFESCNMKLSDGVKS
jgi:isocitrate dehydrogenase kinase/phosphatase